MLALSELFCCKLEALKIYCAHPLDRGLPSKFLAIRGSVDTFERYTFNRSDSLTARFLLAEGWAMTGSDDGRRKGMPVLDIPHASSRDGNLLKGYPA